MSSITMHRDKYCVYTHSIDGEIFYVGKGMMQRPFEHANRNYAWRVLVQAAGKIEVEIVDWYENSREALAVEKELIGVLRPIANVDRHGPMARPWANKVLVNRYKTVPSDRNVARVAGYGRVTDLESFAQELREFLRIRPGEQWEMPQEWLEAWERYSAVGAGMRDRERYHNYKYREDERKKGKGQRHGYGRKNKKKR